MGGSPWNVEQSPDMLDLIQNGREWHVKRKHESCSLEEKKLELRLGPPGGEDWSFTSPIHAANKNQAQKFCSSGNPLGSVGLEQQGKGQHSSSFLQFSSTQQRLPVMTKESSQSCNTKVGDLQCAEKNAFSIAYANTAVPSGIAHKRTGPAPVVGWPPIRSFRKNLACSSSSSKQAPESQHANSTKTGTEKPLENCGKGMFVKINMDGVPIGRKVDLKAYDGYDKLSSAVDELFRGLLAAQRDSSPDGNKNRQEDDKSITRLLDGSGEHTLVYEDNEGDRMLVGDVPWHMFVSTVKRLRVLKSSEVSALNLGNIRQDEVPLFSAAPK